MNTELRDILEKSLTQLPETNRLVFVMKEIEEMSLDEITTCLHISQSIVTKRLEKAKEMLWKSLHEFYKIEDLYVFHLNRCDTMVRSVLNQIKTIETNE